jgi:hypothetical protein
MGGKEELTQNEKNNEADDDAEERSEVALCVDEAGPLAQWFSERHDAQSTERDGHEEEKGIPPRKERSKTPSSEGTSKLERGRQLC